MLFYILFNAATFTRRGAFGKGIISRSKLPMVKTNLIYGRGDDINAMTSASKRFFVAVPRNISAIVMSSLGVRSLRCSIGGNELSSIIVILGCRRGILSRIIIAKCNRAAMGEVANSIKVVSSRGFRTGPLTSIDSLVRKRLTNIDVSTISKRPKARSGVQVEKADGLSNDDGPL